MSNSTTQKKLGQNFHENAGSASADSNSRSLPKLNVIIPGIVFITILVGIYFINPDSKTLRKDHSGTTPYGKIKIPADGFETVAVETKNMDAGQYVWLAVNNPKLKLAWSKQQLPCNTNFNTAIIDDGPEGHYTRSMYVSNKICHTQWKEWQTSHSSGSLHLPPDSKRLDSVKLILKSKNYDIS